jgi:hypothetical protein
MVSAVDSVGRLPGRETEQEEEVSAHQKDTRCAIIDKGEGVRAGEAMANPGKSGRGSPPLHAASEIAIRK